MTDTGQAEVERGHTPSDLLEWVKKRPGGASQRPRPWPTPEEEAWA